MDKLIAVNNLINCLQIMSTKNDSTVWEQCIEIINSLPDEQKHGHWEKLYNKNYKCSVCGAWYETDEEEEILDFDYCPRCGAKMDEMEWEEPEINPCRGCPDYDGPNGCKSNGGCGAKIDEVTNE